MELTINNKLTINDVVDSMNERQKTALYDILGSILDGEPVPYFICGRYYEQYKYSKTMRDVAEYLADKASDERRKLIKLSKR